jgi:hypothetical protein
MNVSPVAYYFCGVLDLEESGAWELFETVVINQPRIDSSDGSSRGACWVAHPIVGFIDDGISSERL